MATKTLFTSTSCNADYVQSMSDQAEANGCRAIDPKACGYALVGKYLVPYTFLTRVKEELTDCQFEYGPVIAENDIFTNEFLASLDQAEREVLMECVLISIACGDFGLNLFASVDEEAAA